MERYLIEVISFQALFLAAYWLLFRHSTFFKTHRAYLLITPLISLILPYIKIGAIQTVVPNTISSVFLPEVILGSSTAPLEMLNSSTPSFQWDFLWVYFIGVIVSFILFLYKLSQLLKLFKYRNSSQDIIVIPRSTVAFTFLNYICIGDGVDSLSRKHILAHERIHVRQRHTWDLILFEALRIVMWFNPLIYLYQKEITRVHEYLADAEAIDQTTKKEYYEKLLNTAFGTNNLSFTNTFYYHSSIKNRITMLQKSKSKKIELLKYAVIIPMILGMLLYVSCSDDIAPEKATNLERQISELHFVAVEQNENLSQEELTKLQALVQEVDKKDNTTKIVYQYTNDEKVDKITTITEVERVQDSLEIPFAVVETVPLFPGCDASASNETRKECFSNRINNFVANEFDTSLGKKLKFSGIQRIYTLFKIDTDGQIRDVRVRAPHPAFKEEALRVLNSLPKMEESAFYEGNPVNVSYTLPIVFKIEE